MDFGELLHTAQKNEQGKKEIRYYSTKFAPPKKEQKNKTLSINVQKFLAKKEAEEKQKNNDARKKRDQLLELRAKDKKATRRVSVMLKRTKSASQAVIDDAVDNDNTAVTLTGPSQPDEDDYGYVSQEAASYYNKMMEKYSKMPEEPKFPFMKKKVSTNLSGTKDRVKAALDKEKEDALLPHRRKRKHAESLESQKDDDFIVPDVVEKREPSKPKFKAPPPLNFVELLKIAEKKQFEPIVIEQKKEDEERPLTKKQKKEFEREREWRERKESLNKINEKPQGLNKIPKINGGTSQGSKKTDDVNLKKTLTKSDSKPGPSISQNLDRNSNISKSDKVYSKVDKPSSERRVPPPHRVDNRSANNVNNNKSILQTKLEKSKSDMKLSDNKGRIPARDQQLKKPPPISEPKLKQVLQSDFKSKQNNDSLPRKLLPNDLRAKQFSPSDLKPKQFPPSDIKPKQLQSNGLKSKPTNGVKLKEFPPKDVKPKQFPPADIRRKEFPSKDVKRKPLLLNKRRILDDDDEEYDSEMDDFIDDDPAEGEDYSRYISEIFGYDKNKYSHADIDDVDNMESTFAQQMKEEVISTKLGIKEDLEDMRMEEEAKKRKALWKKSKK